MAHWLVKSEPDAWSWTQQVEAGAKGTYWNGVRNHSAKLNLMAMQQGRHGLLLPLQRGQGDRRHRRGDPRGLSGPDGAAGRALGRRRFKAVKPLPQPVTLAQVKAEKRLAKMSLVDLHAPFRQP